MSLSSEEARQWNNIIDNKNNNILNRLSNWDISATVISVGAGQTTVHLPTDPVGINITAHNPNEISLEVGDQVTIHKVNGNTNNSVVLFRKTVGFNNIYVDYATGADKFGRAGNGSLYGSENAPFKTLQYAINRLPKNTNSRDIYIYFNTLSSSESISMDGFWGGGKITIRPRVGTTLASTNSIQVVGCSGVRIEIFYLNFTTTSNEGVEIYRASQVAFYNCSVTGTSSYSGFVVSDGSNTIIENCVIANRQNGIMADGVSSVLSNNNSGSNVYGLFAQFNSTIGKNGTQPTGTSGNEVVLAGSVIR